ncbi:MAG TPA: exodeoxyribonuclease VII large subunit [Rhabdochlamydiaceae bacterium]|nr:exodeoxyribonuclease VII large subunit [Rhabdochlamydiaceae bacterium]
MKNNILTVSELTTLIKKQLETQFSFLSVEGEISNLKLQSSGHLYFTLKDRDAQISAVLFKGNSGTLSRFPKDGDKVIVRGELSVYPPRGNYQIIVRQLEYSGVGELLKKLHELKLKLQSLGWFDQALKKSLPRLPKTIGVVTSPTGSVIQDMIQVLSRRFSGFHLILYPVKVQGEGAAAEIAKAIQEFNQYHLADVLIVGRGGGSLEDLWPFNEEMVAAAIKESTIPIVSAVGHETDFTIADFAADVRAPTPSAAAEMVCLEKNEELAFLATMQTRLNQSTAGLIRSWRHRINGLMKQPFMVSPYALLNPYMQKIDTIKEELTNRLSTLCLQKKWQLQGLQKQHQALRPSFQLANAKKNLQQWEKQITQQIKLRLKEKKEHLAQLAFHLKATHPKNLLTKGYCLLFHEKTDSIILRADQVQIDDSVSIQLQDGKLKATIRDKTV